MYRPTSVWTWSFLIVIVVQAILALFCEAKVFAEFQFALKKGTGATSQSRTVPTYLSLFIFGFLYEVVLAYDALRLRNTIQVIGLCIFNLALMIYAAIQIDQLNDALFKLVTLGQLPPTLWKELEPYLIAVPCIVAFVTLLLGFIAWKLYGEFAWTIYKNISADLRLKRRLLTYQIYMTLLKFDFFFFLGFTVQFIVVVTDKNDSEFYLTIAAIPITIAILVLAGWFTRREMVLGMVAVIIVYFGALAYFLFKLIRMYTDESRREVYRPARRLLSGFAVITLIFVVITIINAIWCTTNFNKGLKPHLLGNGAAGGRKKGGHHDDKADTNELPVLAGPAPSRMTID